MSNPALLPVGWTQLTLGELFTSERRGIEPARYPDQEFELWSVPAFPSGVPEIVRGRDVGSNKQRVTPGDVLLCKINPRINRVWVVGDERGNQQIASTEWIVLRGSGVDPNFLAHQLRESSFRERMCAEVSGVGGSLTRARPQTVAALPVVIAPMREQHRIVAKLDGLLASGRAARAALDAVPSLLQQYRHSVLYATFRGHLTADWRLLHPHRQAISSVCDANPARRHRTPPAMARPADLPESWSWERLGSLGLDPEGAVQTGPFGAQLHSDEFVAAGVPVIAVGNLTGIGFTTDKLYHITTGKAAALARYDVQAGDLLFARSGATLGKVCVAPPEVRDWRMTGHILRARLAQDLIDPQLVAYALWGDPRVTQQVVGGIRGMTRPGYNTALLEAIAIPVPPREEQMEMVTRIRDAFQRIDDVGQLLVHLQERHAVLEQATLAKAFRGELVLQDSSDEAADAMLARVREAHASATRAPRRRNPVPT